MDLNYYVYLTSSDLSIKEKWILAIVHAVPYVHGNTRMQKYALLVGKQILDEQEFFSDWQPDNYGGFSRGVAICVTKLANEGYLETKEFTYKEDKKSIQYTLSQKGKEILNNFLKTHSDTFDKIKEILGYYQSKRLIELLNNVYVLYPRLTIKSKIKAEVNKSILQNNSYLSPEYEIAIDAESFTRVSTPPASEHLYGDEYFREKLAKSIGLKSVPNLDPNAFDRLSGIISSKIKTKEFDSEELVKAVRGC